MTHLNFQSPLLSQKVCSQSITIDEGIVLTELGKELTEEVDGGCVVFVGVVLLR